MSAPHSGADTEPATGTQDDQHTDPPEHGSSNTSGTQDATSAESDQRPSPADDDAAEWKALAAELNMSPADVRRRVQHARRWEERAKSNKQAADEVPSLREQVEQLQNDLAERDAREVARNGQMAMATVRSKLSDQGIATGDVSELLDQYDPVKLLKNGEPDTKAIDTFVNALVRAAGRASPDPDQGKRGASAPADMNSMIRRAAGYGGT